MCHIFSSVCLPIYLSIFYTIGVSHNFWTVRERDFTCELIITRSTRTYWKILSLWLWFGYLTFLENWTLYITFEPLEIESWYLISQFLMTRPFSTHQKFWPCDFDLYVWPTFPGNWTLAITFWLLQIGVDIVLVDFLGQDSSAHTKSFDPMTYMFDLLFPENWTLTITCDCYR